MGEICYSSELCEYYLKKKFETKSLNETFIHHPDSNKVAIIIEPRFDLITEAVIYNFMHFLNPLGWNLIIISYSGYQLQIQQKYPFASVYTIGNKHIIFDSSGNPHINIHSYNEILLDKFFWQNIREEIIIIFQRDCIMFRPFPTYFLQYDYAGSNYLYEKAPVIGGINGGFSIRNRNTMIECIEKITWDEINEYRKTRKYTDENTPLKSHNEDIFFTHACEILCKNVPDKYTRTLLCIENDFNIETSVHHGWNKCYASYYHIDLLMKHSPFFSSIIPPPQPNWNNITIDYKK